MEMHKALLERHQATNQVVDGKMKRFIMYRRGDISATHNKMQANSSDEAQFEGVVFSDGTCAIRWLTLVKSTSVWDSFEDAMAIHGHPEYESELEWVED